MYNVENIKLKLYQIISFFAQQTEMEPPQVTVVYDRVLRNKSTATNSTEGNDSFEISDKQKNNMRMRLLVAPRNSQPGDIVELQTIPKTSLKSSAPTEHARKSISIPPARKSLKLNSKRKGNQLRGCTSFKQNESSVAHRCIGKICVADFRRHHPKFAKRLADKSMVPNLDVFNSPLVMVSVPVKKVRFNFPTEGDMSDDEKPEIDSSNHTDSVSLKLLSVSHSSNANENEMIEKGCSGDEKESEHEPKLHSSVEAENMPLQPPASDSMEETKDVIVVLSSDDELESTVNSRQSVSLFGSASAIEATPISKATKPKKTRPMRVWFCDFCRKEFKNKSTHLKTLRHKINAV